MKDIGQQVFWASILGTDLLGHEIQNQQQRLFVLLMCNLYANCAPGPAPLAPVIYDDTDGEDRIEAEYTKKLIQWATSCKNAGDTLYRLLQNELEVKNEPKND